MFAVILILVFVCPLLVSIFHMSIRCFVFFLFSRVMENKMQQLEKDLYYYKMRSRKYKDQLRDFTNDVSTDPDEFTGPPPPPSVDRKASANSKRSFDSADEFHLPPVINHNVMHVDKKEKFDRRFQLDQQMIEESKRLQVRHLFFFFVLFLLFFSDCDIEHFI